MDNIVTRTINLPTSIYGYTVRDKNGDYNVYINSRISYERQVRAYQHEMRHIVNGDFYSNEPLDLVELRAKKEGETL